MHAEIREYPFHIVYAIQTVVNLLGDKRFIYQKYHVCWDQRVPLPYCVRDTDSGKPVR